MRAGSMRFFMRKIAVALLFSGVATAGTSTLSFGHGSVILSGGASFIPGHGAPTGGWTIIMSKSRKNGAVTANRFNRFWPPRALSPDRIAGSDHRRSFSFQHGARTRWAVPSWFGCRFQVSQTYQLWRPPRFPLTLVPCPSSLVPWPSSLVILYVLGSKLTGVSLAFRYVTGYGHAGTGQGANLSLTVNDDPVRSGGEAIYASPHYTEYAYADNNTNYSAPVHVQLTDLSIAASARYTSRLQFVFQNNDRNLQILVPLEARPIDLLRLSLTPTLI